MSRAGDLVVLQDVDTRVGRDTARLAAADAHLQRDEELEQMRRELRRATRANAGADDAVAAQDTVVTALRRRAAELTRHLYDGTIGNPQELIGMQHDLETIQGRIRLEEETELGLMEAAESTTTRVRELSSSVGEREREHEASLPALRGEIARLQEALAALADERAALLARIDAPSLALYERIRQRTSPAVVHLQGDACGGCHMPFAASEIHAVRAGTTLVQCSSCDRVVVP